MERVEKIGISLLGLILIAPVLLAMGMGTWGTLTYDGIEKFTTVDEAMNFQKYIIQIADEKNAYVEVEISKHSPPVVSYRITLKPSVGNEAGLIPEGKRLDIGVQHFDIVGIWITIITAIILALGGMVVLWWAIWSKEE
jgi:hypothetical protein